MALRLLEEPAAGVEERHHRADERKRLPSSEFAYQPLAVRGGALDGFPVLVWHADEELDHDALPPGVQGPGNPVLHLPHGVGPAAGRRAYLRVVGFRGE